MFCFSMASRLKESYNLINSGEPHGRYIETVPRRDFARGLWWWTMKGRGKIEGRAD
jgi:hypothetical protein